jgi:Predicted transcriptional regulator
MTHPSPNRMMRLNEVLDITGLSRATLYRKVAEGTFPTQHKLGARCSAWRAGEVDIWLRNPAKFTLVDLDRVRNAERATHGTVPRRERRGDHTGPRRRRSK